MGRVPLRQCLAHTKCRMNGAAGFEREGRVGRGQTTEAACAVGLKELSWQQTRLLRVHLRGGKLADPRQQQTAVSPRDWRGRDQSDGSQQGILKAGGGGDPTLGRTQRQAAGLGGSGIRGRELPDAGEAPRQLLSRTPGPPTRPPTGRTDPGPRDPAGRAQGASPEATSAPAGLILL